MTIHMYMCIYELCTWMHMHRMLYDTHHPYEYMNISSYPGNKNGWFFTIFTRPQHTSSRPEHKKADILKAPSRILMPRTSDALLLVGDQWTDPQTSLLRLEIKKNGFHKPSEQKHVFKHGITCNHMYSNYIWILAIESAWFISFGFLVAKLICANRL